MTFKMDQYFNKEFVDEILEEVKKLKVEMEDKIRKMGREN